MSVSARKVWTKSKSKKKKVKLKIPEVEKPKLQDRLFAIGWKKIIPQGLEILLEEIETGNKKEFNYVKEMEEWLIKIEKERGISGELDGKT